MIHIERILCPIDFSEVSSRALYTALAFARWYRAEVLLLHVYGVLPATQPYPTLGSPVVVEPARIPEDEHRRLEEALDRLAQSAPRGEVVVRPMLAAGDPVDQILAEARAHDADLIVLGTHGRRGFERLTLGSVAEKVLRRASAPVLTIPARASGVPEETVHLKQIVCPVDFSASSMRALSAALSLAQEAGARLAVLHVLPSVAEEDDLDFGRFDLAGYRSVLETRARERLRAAIPEEARTWSDPEEVVAGGRPHREILRIAEARRADLIVMGVHGRGAVDLLLFGSTTHHVVREAICPVLTIRAPESTA